MILTSSQSSLLPDNLTDLYLVEVTELSHPLGAGGGIAAAAAAAAGVNVPVSGEAPMRGIGVGGMC